MTYKTDWRFKKINAEELILFNIRDSERVEMTHERHPYYLLFNINVYEIAPMMRVIDSWANFIKWINQKTSNKHPKAKIESPLSPAGSGLFNQNLYPFWDIRSGKRLEITGNIHRDAGLIFLALENWDEFCKENPELVFNPETQKVVKGDDASYVIDELEV